MKSSIVIVMIVCGTILIALPYINQAVIMRQVSATLVALNKDVNLTGSLPKHADIACIIGGFVMVFVGAKAGLGSGKSRCKIRGEVVSSSPNSTTRQAIDLEE
jgi:hypothetical protein